MKSDYEPEELELAELMKGLDPSREQVRRMEQVIAERLAPPRQRSLAAEWIDILRIRPLATPALALAGCAGIVLLSPISAVLLTALGGS